jgi:putative SbcD/Mre11-related phosphoesterase
MDPYPLSDELWLCEQAAYLPKLKTLVVADLQLGWEQSLRDRGADVPLDGGKELLALFERLLAQTGAARVVIDGDLKHEFGRTSFQERRDLLRVLGFLKARVEVVVVRGNHDTFTAPLAAELGISMLDSWSSGTVGSGSVGRDGGFYVLHGHVLPDENDPAFKQAHTVIIGHAHPAISISDGVRKERYKCFLLGKFQQKQLLVLPSCSVVVEGTNVLQGASSHSPLLQVDASMVFVLADGIRPFGKVSDLRRILG